MSSPSRLHGCSLWRFPPTFEPRMEPTTPLAWWARRHRRAAAIGSLSERWAFVQAPKAIDLIITSSQDVKIESGSATTGPLLAIELSIGSDVENHCRGSENTENVPDKSNP